MFESFTVADLGDRAGWDITVRENGWQFTLALPTVEFVVWRFKKGTSRHIPYDLEFAVARRIGGAPECLGMHQVKWGTNLCPPKDMTPLSSLLRYLPIGLGITPIADCCRPIGTIGPWTWKSTIALNGPELILTVVDEQAEKKTPFYGSLFAVDATNLGDGSISGATSELKVQPAFADLEWIGFDDLIKRYGKTTGCIYWQIFFLAIEALTGNLKMESFFMRPFTPGTYTLELS